MNYCWHLPINQKHSTMLISIVVHDWLDEGNEEDLDLEYFTNHQCRWIFEIRAGIIIIQTDNEFHQIIYSNRTERGDHS